MEDLSRRKRRHNTAYVYRERNDNSLNIKRLRHRPQPIEMQMDGDDVDVSSSRSSCSYNNSRLLATNCNGITRAKSTLPKTLNDTEHIQSKLGKLCLNQTTEPTKRLHFSDCNSSPCSSRNKRTRRMDDFDHELIDRNDSQRFCCNKPDLLNHSSTITSKQTNVDLIPDELKYENIWFSATPSQPSQTEMIGTTSEENNESTNVSRSRLTLPHDFNQNTVSVPAASTYSISNLNPNVEIDGLFSVSPDMSDLVTYSGLPLMPIFARRNNNIDPLGPIPFLDSSSKFDDEGFDEPNDSGIANNTLAMSSDAEEDFAL